MRKLATALALAAALLVGCAGGAGPDRATDRACKELKAADTAVSAALAAGTKARSLTAAQSTALAGFSAQLRVVATDVQGGALASTLGVLGAAADEWDAAFRTGDLRSLVAIGDQVDRKLDACTAAGVSL